MICTHLTRPVLLALLATASVLVGTTVSAQEGEKGPEKGATAAPNPLYKVVDGFKVEWRTMQGFRAWRAGACDRCHGANQQGLVGPSLIESLKTLSKEEFVLVVTEGRLDKGMPSFKTSKTVMEHIDELYGYLKGRSDGRITRARVEELKEE
jgi:hypothetical protein